MPSAIKLHRRRRRKQLTHNHVSTRKFASSLACGRLELAVQLCSSLRCGGSFRLQSARPFVQLRPCSSRKHFAHQPHPCSLDYSNEPSF
uniref:Uncharacterized protein n=1 Tax=Knipowitschia caucasica TaxID=637954 RepID=A0AAV2JDU2_KNICA